MAALAATAGRRLSWHAKDMGRSLQSSFHTGSSTLHGGSSSSSLDTSAAASSSSSSDWEWLALDETFHVSRQLLSARVAGVGAGVFVFFFFL